MNCASQKYIKREALQRFIQSNKTLMKNEKIEGHGIYRKCRKQAYKKIFFEDINLLLNRVLSESQLEKLNIHENSSTYTVHDQLFLRYIDNRYSTFLTKEEVLENARSCIETYRFLLDSNLDPKRIRYHFIKALMDVISTGSGVYFLWWDSLYDEFGWFREENDPFRGFTEPIYISRRSSWKVWRGKFQETFEIMREKYPDISCVDIFRVCDPETRTNKKHITLSLWQQLLISYAYPLFLREKKGELTVEEFKVDFFKRHKWCLERLSKCNRAFFNKYKEKICEDMAYYLGKDPDLHYYPAFIFPFWEKRDIPIDIDFLSKVRNAILDCFSSEELSLFNEKDADENTWDLGDQIQDRYYSKYPSFSSWEEIETKIREIIEEYKPLLNLETFETIREIILDEIESVVFVSKPTHLWNLEMQKNLESVNPEQINGGVVKAVDILISYLPSDSVDNLEIEVNGKRFNLREQLLARWKTSLFSSNSKKFRKYLSELHIYTPNSPSNWKKSTSGVDLQAFLGEIDMFFLYPSKGRKIKKLLGRLDTGRVVGGINSVKRVSMSFYYADANVYFPFTMMLTVPAGLILLAWVAFLHYLLK